VRGSDSNRDNGLTQSNDHDQAVALNEVVGSNVEARRNARRYEWRYELDHDRNYPSHIDGGTLQQDGPKNKAGRDQVEGGETHEHAPANLFSIKGGVHDDDEKVGQAKSQTVIIESLGGGQSAYEESGHPTNQKQAAQGQVGGNAVRKPDVSAVHPIENGEHKNSAGGALERRIVPQLAR
jgi:hypothetical protein